ncbi:MAG: ABC transporter permease [Mucilaginibacter polytrichastri]|nr:ABC transporter permease [Mucilaginibacter polytrichastri]
MLKNYFRIAWRNLLKNRTFSLINISGLALGTLCCVYIILYVQDQYSYDRHHDGAGDIYRITTEVALTGDKHVGATVSPPVAPAMKKDFAEVREFTRAVPLLGEKQQLLRYKNKSFYASDMLFVDPSFFAVFTYHFLAGSAQHALDAPNTVVLDEAVAAKLFGTENPVGKVIEIEGADAKQQFTVKGVTGKQAGKTQLSAGVFISMNSDGMGRYIRENTVWAGNNFTYSYVKLSPGSDAAALERKLPAFLNKYGGEELRSRGMQKKLHLQPLQSIHTTTGYEVESGKTVSPSFLRLLLLIAFLIQVIACINFMNLSTARASKRAKEVGVRKVIGAGKYDLVRQFLGESFLLSLIGIFVALPLLVVLLPYLNRITEAQITPAFLRDYRVWLMLFSLVIFTGLFAGSYPAFYLSAFRAIRVIKGNFTSHISAAGIRRSLVVFQFVLSIVLIAGIIVIYSQLRYMQQKDLGFNKDQKLVFHFYTASARQGMKNFAADLRQLSGIKAVSEANNYLSQFVFNDFGVYLPGGDMTTSTNVQSMLTDEHFAQANDLRIVSGRDLRISDTGKVLVNEMLLRRLGLKPDEAIGKKLYSHYPPQAETHVEIAGVLRDFNYNSLHDQVRPFMLQYQADGGFTQVIVSAGTKDYKQLLAAMERIWHRDVPGAPFEYSFLDDDVQKQYAAEVTLSRIINAFTLMAIFISCLGLFGLAAFSAEQRAKEIGIRKVLGASIGSVVGLLSKDFVRLVAFAFLIAAPFSWWASGQWLQDFAYRVPVSWWMFALAGMAALLIAVFTVSFQALRAALANPVKSLRRE